MRFQRPWDDRSLLFRSRVVQAHRDLSLFIHSFLYSLTQSFNKHFLNAYSALNAGERVEGARLTIFLLPGNLHGCMCGARAGGGRQSANTGTGGCRTLTKDIRDTKWDDASKRDGDRLLPGTGDQGGLL